jgi:hypothetical protein
MPGGTLAQRIQRQELASSVEFCATDLLEVEARNRPPTVRHNRFRHASYGRRDHRPVPGGVPFCHHPDRSISFYGDP